MFHVNPLPEEDFASSPSFYTPPHMLSNEISRQTLGSNFGPKARNLYEDVSGSHISFASKGIIQPCTTHPTQLKTAAFAHVAVIMADQYPNGAHNRCNE